MNSSAPARRRFHAAFALALAIMAAPAAGAEVFPYDRQLILDASRIGKVKRLPSLTLSSDGTEARIELWCKTASAQVAVGDGVIQIAPAPLPEALPQYMSDGQCSPERMAADVELLGALSQVTTWQNAGGAITLGGPTVLRFRPSDH